MSKFIVIGKYNSERNSYIPNGDIRKVCSHHKTRKAAAANLEKYHYRLGGCEGSDWLTKVMVKVAPLNTSEGQELIKNDMIDTYIHNDWVYVSVDFFSSIEFSPLGEYGADCLKYNYV